MTFLGMPTAPRGVGQLRQEAPFPVAAARALDDSQLRRNLGHATSTIRAKRAAAVAEVPDWQELRAAGAAIKDEVLAHLDRYLLQLEEQVTARGGTVHWAGDANEANRIVTGLIRATGQRHVVKVKSMATQEIGLNEALAAAGIEATETDLAELIVQLGHDRPSHILVPAIHRNRNQIRDIFLREMPDAPAQLSDEPAALTAAARAHLRRKFLAAQVAISGANFAIAETGTLAVVESEGNGRMCLTLPRTLITVMGIEKILPAWRDLEVFLQLLPRSSTAERMNPYTSMWAGAVEGQEFHLVLLDNGRTATLADPRGRAALRRARRAAARAALRPDPAPARPAGGMDLLPGPAPAAPPDVPRLVGGAVPVSRREEMLARIRAATADITGLPEVPRRYAPAGRGPGLADEALVSRFEERASDYRATVRHSTAGEVAQVIADAVAARGAERIGVPGGFPAPWSALLPDPVPDDPPLDVGALDALDGVVTTVALAIAETGTIVLDTGPGQGSRAFSLVPDYHLAVVRTGQIVGAVPDAVAALDPARPLTWISGPSATSDIELSRVEGVHGPRTLDIVIVSD